MYDSLNYYNSTVRLSMNIIAQTLGRNSALYNTHLYGYDNIDRQDIYLEALYIVNHSNFYSSQSFRQIMTRTRIRYTDPELALFRIEFGL